MWRPVVRKSGQQKNRNFFNENTEREGAVKRKERKEILEEREGRKRVCYKHCAGAEKRERAAHSESLYNDMTETVRTEQEKQGNPPLGSGLGSPVLPLHEDEPATCASALALRRVPGEGEKAYAAFREYVALGPGRSLVLLAGKMRKNAKPLERWSVKHGWQARVAEHTAALAEVESKSTQALVMAKAVASGIATDKTEVSAEVQTKLDVDWEIALKKVYGPEAQAGSVVDVEARGGHV
jgi:hypothetical protein